MTYLRNYAVLNVKDRLARIRAWAKVGLFGSGNYAMRVWLDPQKVAERGLTASEVVKAIREQNVQVAAGVIGALAGAAGRRLQLSVNAQGRLKSEQEFGADHPQDLAGRRRHAWRDVARIELAAAEYGLRSLLDNKPAVAIRIFQAPGANALDVSSDRCARPWPNWRKDFPPSVEYRIVYDPTQFVRASIKAVDRTRCWKPSPWWCWW
jgi:multidrug efflux pump